MIHHTRSGNAHIQYALRLAHTVERTGHKGVVLHRIGKYHQFGAAKTVIFLGDLGGPFNDLTHFCHRIHIDAGTG